jgi:signal transduction histidine kinase/FixJ family two-component response regulator
MRLAPVVAIVCFLVLLLTWLSLRAINPEAELFDQALAEIDHFATMENALYRDIFTARAGTSRNYDPLVAEIVSLRSSLDRLRKTAVIDAETAEAVDRLAASVDRQEDLVERFKSDNALLHNSLSFFGRFSVRPVSSELGPAISSAAAAMLDLTLDTSPAAAGEVEDRLNELAKQAQASDSDSIIPLLAHGRLLHDLLPAVDNTLKAMRAVPRKSDQDALRSLVLARQLASRTTARQFRRVLYATSLLLVGFLVHLGLRLRARARALQRRAALEHVIAGISMRFINAPSQNIDTEIEQALADMGRRIGSDRAYFVRSGAAPLSYVWSRTGRGFPPGWPEGAPALAARFDPVVDGIIQIPGVDWLPTGENKSACLALGLGGWACATSASPDGGSFALGFDAVGRPCHITAPNELGLLRRALDTIVYAVQRQAMEKERARLETRLQQARRMEAVGTITSGIAHNFNNILGGILGHSEVLEDRLGSDARLCPNLDAIRRGAERARDLVDQILVFGRRREAQRRPVSVRALVAEAESLLKVSLPPEIEFSIREPSAAAVVSGEPEQLQQVIFNLCNNAAQAMDNAGRIELEAEMVDLTGARSLSHGELQPGRYVRLVVRDSGRGMDLATLARIFEPFFTTRPTGNGLGLSTVRAIVREHGGRMNVTSTPGEGSRFEVWLPGLATAELPGQEGATALPLGRGETIMLVADDNARLLRDEEMLAALGYEPVGFTDPEAALAACRARPERFDALLIADFGSVKASLELAAALHQAAPGVPVVLETRSAEEIGADSLVNAGIADVVRWPMAAAEIAAALDRCSQLRKRDAKAPSNATRETYSMHGALKRLRLSAGHRV